jgi:hypothetical protein
MKKFIISNQCIFCAVLFLIIFLPALSISVFNLYKIYEIGKNEIKQEAIFLAKLTAIRQEQAIEESRRFLSLLSTNLPLQSTDPAVCQDSLAKVLKQYPKYTNIIVLGGNGDILCSGIDIKQIFNLSYRDYFQKMLKSRYFVVGEYTVGAVTGKPVLPLAYPILSPAGEVTGAIVAYEDLSWMHDFNSKVSLPDGMSLLMLNKKGIILDCFSEKNDCVGKKVEDIFSQGSILDERVEGTLQSKGFDEVVKDYSFTTLDLGLFGEKLYILISLPSETHPEFFTNIFISNLALLLSVAGMAWMISKKESESCGYSFSGEDKKKK